MLFLLPPVDRAIPRKWTGSCEVPVWVSLHQVRPLKLVLYGLIFYFVSWLTTEALCHFPDMVNAYPIGALLLMEHLAGDYWKKVPTE